MLTLAKTSAKYFTTCCGCGEQVRTCESYLQVMKNGKAVRGERYCVNCAELAADNNPGSLFQVPGDNRWFISTPNGPRAGAEHTGVVCEDAPCCGCCG